MGTTSIGIGINVNGLDKLEKASNLLTEFTNLNPMIEDSQTPSLVEKSSTIDILEKQEELELQKFNQILNNLNSAVANLIDKVTKLNSETRESLETETKKNDQAQNTQNVENSKYTTEKSEKSANTYNDGQSSINNVQSIANIATQIANQNVTGGVISGISSVGAGIRNKGKEIASSEDGDMELASMLGKLGGAIAIAGIALKTADVVTQKYESSLSGIDGLLQTYGLDSMYKGGANNNARYGLNLRNTLTELNTGTGLSNEEFIAYANSLGKYGINDVKLGGQMTKDAAFWQRYTGADMSSTLNFMGTVQRLGGNGIEATEKVYEKALESGLSKNQFPEFLSGVQRAIEQGVAQGFIRSSEDVAENLSLLARLSGGDPSWMGERGANRYSQMSSAMANNTSLSTTSSLIMYRTADSLLDGNEEKELGKNKYLKESSADWLNTLAYMEKGDLSGAFLKKLKENVETSYKGDVASQVLTYKEQFGLNYQGAIEVYNMLQNLGNNATNEEIKTQIDRITGNKEFQSDSTRLQDSLNSIETAVVNLGKGSFDVKIAGLEGISNTVENIYGEMLKGGFSGSAKEIGKNLFPELIKDGDPQARANLESLGKIADNGSIDDVMVFKSFEEWFNNLPQWKIDYFNETNRFNDIIKGEDIRELDTVMRYDNLPRGTAVTYQEDSMRNHSDMANLGVAMYMNENLYKLASDYATKNNMTVENAIDTLYKADKTEYINGRKNNSTSLLRAILADNFVSREEETELINAIKALTQALGQPIEVN